MWQERQAELLRDEIEAVLAPLSNISGFYDLVKEPLIRIWRGLGAKGKPWPLLPLVICEAVSGHYEQTLPAAAAIQLFTAAADVFDDVEDSDSSESLPAKYGSAVAMNVATTLLFLAEKAMTQLRESGVEDSTIVRVMEAVNSHYTTACAGQHLDISRVSDTTVAEDQYLKIIEMKTASQIECACHIGALLATKKQELVDAFSTFGHNLGMAAQIANDIQGVMNGTDVVKRKITLPVIYALAQTEGETHAKLELAFQKQAESNPETEQIRDLLFRVGAIQYATIRMETYRQDALDMLSEVERAGTSTERLRLFVI